MNTKNQKDRAVYLFIILFVLGIVVLFLVNRSGKLKENEKRELKLRAIHSDVVNRFQLRVKEFGTLVGGIRAHINNNSSEISEEMLASYLKQQLKDLNFQDSLAVSFIDADHYFRISLNKYEKSSSNLVGLNVRDLRSEEKIKRLDRMMMSDSLRIFDPINLIEGWVGIPFDFGVIRDGKPIGYIAALINFGTIIDPIYNEEIKENYAIHFSFGDGIDFDRHKVYDGTDIYSNERDEEYYANFNIQTDNFEYTNFTLFGQDFKIGVSYKEEPAFFSLILVVLGFWILTIFIFGFFVLKQFYKLSSLNKIISHQNEKLLAKNQEIEAQSLDLKELTATKTKFFSIIAHDLKGPIGALDSALQLLKFEEFPNPEISGLIDEMGLSSQNILKLLFNLLDWSRIQTGELTMQPGNINVFALVKESVQLLKPMAADKGILLGVWPEEPVYAFCDKNMTQTVVRNLISNGIKFTSKFGRINITIDDYESKVSITVSDTGIGMSDEHLMKLFNVDKQIRKEGTAGEKGTGLGLLLAKDLIEMQQGKFNVTSELGKGSSFTFTLPKEKKYVNKPVEVG